MKIEGEIEDVEVVAEDGSEVVEERLTMLSIEGTRKELDLLGRFLIHCAESLKQARIDPNTFQVSTKYLCDYSREFEGMSPHVSVFLPIGDED